MNHTYKTLYNTALGAWVAVPETARNHGKAPRSYHRAPAGGLTFARTALASALLLAGGQALAAIPEGTAVRSTDIAIGLKNFWRQHGSRYQCQSHFAG